MTLFRPPRMEAAAPTLHLRSPERLRLRCGFRDTGAARHRKDSQRVRAIDNRRYRRGQQLEDFPARASGHSAIRDGHNAALFRDPMCRPIRATVDVAVAPALPGWRTSLQLFAAQGVLLNIVFCAVKVGGSISQNLNASNGAIFHRNEIRIGITTLALVVCQSVLHFLRLHLKISSCKRYVRTSVVLWSLYVLVSTVVILPKFAAVYGTRGLLILWIGTLFFVGTNVALYRIVSCGPDGVQWK